MKESGAAGGRDERFIRKRRKNKVQRATHPQLPSIVERLERKMGKRRVRETFKSITTTLQ